MDDRGFGGLDNAPDMGRDFDQSHDMPAMEYDAQAWEPAEEYEVEQPSKLEPTLDLTPGGALEHEVHTELDEAARKRILEAQRQHEPAHELAEEQELDFDTDNLARDFDNARQYDNDAFETGRRFERDNEREQGDRDWER